MEHLVLIYSATACRLAPVITTLVFRLCQGRRVPGGFLLGHLESLDYLSRVVVWADAVDMDLVLIDVVNKKVGRVETNGGALIAIHLDGENNCAQLFVD